LRLPFLGELEDVEAKFVSVWDMRIERPARPLRSSAVSNLSSSGTAPFMMEPVFLVVIS
jgi:hypothetical protein